MRFVGRGHENVRATHDKTLEITAEAQIGVAATCVVTVAARADDPRPLAGPVRIGIAVDGGPDAQLQALANPSWEPGGTAVIRRSPLRLPGTLATEADAVAADLPADLVEALRSPDARVVVDVEPVPGEHPALVLFAADPARPGDPRLRAELDAAGRVIAQDSEAARLVRALGGGNGAANGAPTGLARAGDAAVRTLVVATRRLPGAQVLAELADPAVALDAVGLPAPLAAAAACPSRAPLFWTDEPRPGDALAAAPATARVLVRCPGGELAALLDRVTALRPDTAITLAQPFAPPQRVVPGTAPALARDDDVYLCIAPARSSAETVPLDPPVVEAMRALLADGVPTRAAARALAALTGLPRRDAYATVLRLAGTGDAH